MNERAIIERAQKAVDERVFPGCVVGAVFADGKRMIVPIGSLAYESGAHEVRAATVYDLASVTKSIPVASLALAFAAEGKFALADPVARFLPELKNDYGATIEDLLRYRVHGVQLSNLRHMTSDAIRNYVFEHGFDGPPGESNYTNFPAFLLGMIIERVGGKSLESLGRSYFFDRLDMPATTFFPSAADCAPTEIDGFDELTAGDRGEVCGLPHDESAYQFAIAGECAGHAGLFSTAPDLLNFLEGLLRPNVRFTKSNIDIDGASKTGFTGTSVCVDPSKGVAFVILSNRTYPKRPTDDSAINAFRADIADIILGSI
jgi:CubicO group peptidase (beta-lactamase class C family)